MYQNLINQDPFPYPMSTSIFSENKCEFLINIRSTHLLSLSILYPKTSIASNKHVVCLILLLFRFKIALIFLIKCTSFFSSLFFSYVSKRICTCIRSYLQTKSYFHTYSYTQPVVLIVVVVIVVSMLFSFFDSNKKNEAKENAIDEVGYWGLFFCCIWCFMLLLLKDGWIGFMNVLPFHPNEFDEKNTFCSLQEATAAKEVVATDFFWHESISNSTKHKSWQIYIS